MIYHDNIKAISIIIFIISSDGVDASVGHFVTRKEVT